MVEATIDNMHIEVKRGTTILEAAKQLGIKIPTLCAHPALPASAACGICIVKAKNMRGKMLRACCTPLEEGMELVTYDSEIIKVRRNVLELILSDHPDDCLQCGRNGSCELQSLAFDFNLRAGRFDKIRHQTPKDESTGSIVLDPDKCIKCGRCLEVCQHIQDVWALTFLNRGINTRFAPSGDINLAQSPCVRCGQCSAHCPVGAIYEHKETSTVWEALQDDEKHCVVQIAPAVRVALAEEFGMPPGTNTTKKIYTALRRIGFNAVFDTNFGADLTIMEEASEFIQRFVHGKGELPMITTCCPSWVDFMEKYHDDMLPHFSTCKSPHEMLGVLSKTYYPQKNSLDAKDVYMVSVMPCTSKKYEISRSDEMMASGYKDVDVVLTTREFARLIKQAGIDLMKLPEEPADHLLGKYAGAGTIFGATGGVMEAALRTAYYFATGSNPREVDFKESRGLDGIKEFSIDVGGKDLRIAVTHGLGNVSKVIEKVRKAKEKGEEPPYHFIEVMACPGGCVSGGGQPYSGSTNDIREQRAAGLYEDDLNKKDMRCSHENPYITKLYEEFLEKPLSEKSHHLLHNEYKSRAEYEK